MAIYANGKIKGEKGEFEGIFFVNTGTDVVLIPKKIAEKIEPKLVGRGELVLADGWSSEMFTRLRLSSKTGKEGRKLATIEEREEVAISFEVLRELNTLINTREEKIEFQD